MNTKLKKYTLDEIKNDFIGKIGSAKRDIYEYELQMDIIGELIKKARLERNLSQEELGKLIGVQKAQISRLENRTGNVTLNTIIKVFNALKAKLRFQLEFEGQRVNLA
jgi:HTH-type transcriptional regulator / antitoxin HipB